MVKKWIIIFLLPCLSLTAQSNEATSLYEEGIALLTKEGAVVFDKLKALEKFLQSFQLLENNNNPKDSLYINTEEKITALFKEFISFENSDSLLNTTLFFPDSIFQNNPSYSFTTKALIAQILDSKRQEKRTAFFKLQGLRFPTALLKTGEPSSRITFENYWPLEVMAFEKWLRQQEAQWKNYPSKAKEELLAISLQNQLQALQRQEEKTLYESNTKRQSEQITQAAKDMETATAKYQQLKNIGLGILGGLFLLGYFLRKKTDQALKRNQQSLLEEKKRSEDLLTNILPPEVVRELKRKGTVKAQEYETVSVFFSDFKNFSQISESHSAEALVSELDYCFTAFDQIIDKYRLQKVKTIGDAYMCVGGLYTRGELHVLRMVAAALEIQQVLAERKKERIKTNNFFFEARIGIHTGPVVAGVIGSKKIAFDVWGDTVNVAQQMEQHSAVGKVNISGETYQIVQEQFECTHRGMVTAKNQQTYDMYYVDKGIIS